MPVERGTRYFAFVDPSGGSGDSFTLAIGHHERRGDLAILDAVREVRPPFSPEAVVEEFFKLLKSYRMTRVVGDPYGGEWPREQFRKHGIGYEVSAKSKSDLYRDFLPMLNSGAVRLLDHPRPTSQLSSLRRTSRGGRDSIDHPPGAHDDVANAAAGLLAGLSQTARNADYASLRWVVSDDDRPRSDVISLRPRSIWEHPSIAGR